MTLVPWSRRTQLITAVAGLVLVVLAWQAWQLRRARNSQRDTALVADTLRAALDTSRRVGGKLGDSLGAVTRLVVQLRQESDALDRQLGTERTAKAQLVVKVRELVTTVRSTDTVYTDTAGSRRAHFDVRQTPYTVAADVTLPAGPASTGQLALRVAVDSATIALRLGCTTARAAGVRSAVATATGPAWLPLAVGRVEQSPDVCNPKPATVAALSWWRRCFPTVGAGYGVVLAADGRVYHGPTAAVVVDVLRCVR